MSEQAPLALCSRLTLQRGERMLVAGLELATSPGTLTIIAGRTGAGKSTLADVLFHLRRDHRDLTVAGDVHDAASHRGALVLQQCGGFAHLNDEQNLALVGAHATAGLGARPTEGPRSGGERRRLAVARAMATDRQLLWLDEPFAGLDVRSVDRMCGDIAGAVNAGRAVVVVTHRLDVAHGLASGLEQSRCIVIGAGGRVAEANLTGTVAEFVVSVRELMEDPSVPVPAPVPPASRRRMRLAAALVSVASALTALRWTVERGPSGDATRRTMTAAARIGGFGIGFTLVVGALFGVIVLLVAELSPFGSNAVAFVRRLGPEVLLRMAPPLGAVLAAASSGASTASWLAYYAAARELDAVRTLSRQGWQRIIGGTVAGMAGAQALAIAGFGAGIALGWALVAGPAPVKDAMAEALFGSETSLVSWALLKAVGYAVIAALAAVVVVVERVRTSADIGRAVAQGIVVATVVVVAIEATWLLVELQHARAHPFLVGPPLL